MPKGKKVSRQERAGWLDQYEGGMTMIQIAEKSGRDDSTISKGIRQAQDERTRGVARADLYRTTLEMHNKAMVAALARHKARLDFKYAHQIASSHSHPGQGGMPSSDFPFERDVANFTRHNDWHVEGIHALENELVQEHLSSRVKMWNAYRQWLDDHARYLWHVWRLSMNASNRFQKESGLPPVNEGEGFYDSCSIRLVEAAIELAGQGKSEIVKKLNIRDNILATSTVSLVFSRSGESLATAKAAFESVVADLGESEDAKAVAVAVPKLQKELPVIRRQFELIEVMGIVEGTCEACKPYVK